MNKDQLNKEQLNKIAKIIGLSAMLPSGAYDEDAMKRFEEESVEAWDASKEYQRSRSKSRGSDGTATRKAWAASKEYQRSRTMHNLAEAMLEVADRVYYLSKSLFAGLIDIKRLDTEIARVAVECGRSVDFCLDIAISKYSLRARDGNQENKEVERGRAIYLLINDGANACYRCNSIIQLSWDSEWLYGAEGKLAYGEHGCCVKCAPIEVLS